MTQAQPAVPAATHAKSDAGNEFEQLAASARDALTDDMVARLGATIGDGLDLLDRLNRSGIVKALPAVARLVDSGDLDRLVNLARLMGSIEDSLSDDIVRRLALVAAELVALADRLARNDGFLRLIDALGHDDVQRALADMAKAVGATKTQTAARPASKGGFGGLWRLAKDPGTQDALEFLSLFGRQLRNAP